MRVSSFALLPLLALAPVAVHADDASKTAKIEEMFRITKVDQLQRQVMEQMQGALSNMFDQPGIPADVKADHKELEDEVFAIIKKRVTWEKMKPDFVKLYADNLTEPELDAIIAFYKTPGGIALLEKLPILTKRGMEIGQAQMKDVGPEIQETVQKFIERHKAK